MKHDNQCFDCLEKGCGKHAQCEAYLDYFKRNNARSAQKVEDAKLNEYTVTAIRRQKSGTHSTANRYRPKGRW